MKSIQIFTVWSCDEWKTKPMNLLMCTVRPKLVKQFISKLINSGEATYRNDLCDAAAKQADLFEKDWDVLTRERLNDGLSGIYYDYCSDGIEI